MDVENPAFEAYLESLGVPQGGSVPFRGDMIAAMYRAALVSSNGWCLPVFPLAKLRGGWIGWIAETIDLQGAEGWPSCNVATRHVVREWTRKSRRDGLVRDSRYRTDAIVATVPDRFDEFSALLRFTHRWRGEERAKLVRGFSQAVGLPRLEERTHAFIDTCERIFTSSLRTPDWMRQRRWRRLAKELGIETK